MPADPVDPTITLKEQIACVCRELEMRRVVYPKLVAEGKMTQRASDMEFARMNAVLATLESLRDEVPPF